MKGTSPSRTPCPQRTSNPRVRAFSSAQRASRVLPMPSVPSMSRAEPSPERARSKAAWTERVSPSRSMNAERLWSETR